MTDTTPAAELRAAAFLLRNPMRGLTLAVDPDVAEPLADWLDVYANRFAHWVGPHVPAELGHALAVARALNGGQS